MSESIDDLSIDFTDEEGNHLVRQIEKTILTKGSWSTIMYLYEELDPKTGGYKGPKISIRRYQKSQGNYKQRSKFNISSLAQAKQVIGILQNWSSRVPEGAENEGSDSED